MFVHDGNLDKFLVAPFGKRYSEQPQQLQSDTCQDTAGLLGHTERARRSRDASSAAAA